MNRSVLIGVIVIVLAALGYWQFVYKPGQAEQAATDAAAAATEAATDAASTATEAATDAAAAATEAANAAMAAFDPANFNAQAWTTAVDGLQIPDAAKATIKTAIEAAAADPTKVQAAIDAIKAAVMPSP